MKNNAIGLLVTVVFLLGIYQPVQSDPQPMVDEATSRAKTLNTLEKAGKTTQVKEHVAGDLDPADPKRELELKEPEFSAAAKDAKERKYGEDNLGSMGGEVSKVEVTPKRALTAAEQKEMDERENASPAAAAYKKEILINH